MPTSRTTTQTSRSSTASAGVLLLSAKPHASKPRLSASCQQIVEEEFTPNAANIIVRSCLADVALYPSISGHLCNKTPLVPSSLYSDMALTVGSYIWKKLRPKMEAAGINVSDMEVLKPTIAKVPQEHPGQYVEIHVEANLDNEDIGGFAKCEFRNVHPDGRKIQDTAHCSINFENRSLWMEDWSRVDFMAQGMMSTMEQHGHLGGSAHRMQRGLAYKVFSSFVTYSPKYQGMDEVTFNGLEGTSKVSFQTKSGDYCAPFHLDNSCHLSGFLCNAYDLETDESIYISEGWIGLKIFDVDELLHTPGEEMTSQIRNYTRMQEKPGNIVQGDVYVFRDNEICAVWEGVKFKRVPRKVVNMLLPPPKLK